MKTLLFLCLIIGIATTNSCIAQSLNSQKNSTTVYFEADQMPKPAGCVHALSDEIAMKFGDTQQYKSGKINIQFTVNTEGTIENVYLNKSNYPEMNQKVIDIFSNLETPWEPGIYCNEKVYVSMSSTVIFKNGWMKIKINNEVLL